MDMNFDHDSWLRRARTPRQGTPEGTSFDWHGLSARLTAAYALRRSLARRDVLAEAPSGSFDEQAASALSTYEMPEAQDWQAPHPQRVATSPHVNPVGLEDGKAASVINAGVAGPSASGDRGLK